MAIQPRTRLALAASGLILLIAMLVVALHASGPAAPPLPLPGAGRSAPRGDPFAYRPERETSFAARASAGAAHVLFVKSPGGVLATAARVAGWRRMIDAATAGTGVDPGTLEAIVFLESAGRADARVGADLSGAAGLTQILAQTGQSLLGMHVDLAQSRRLTRAIDVAGARGDARALTHLERERARYDDRFDPAKALAATVRYLTLARARLHRADLAVVSYHMGIGNLQAVLTRYGGRSAPYVQLYFDTAPDRHSSAYSLLHSFGDDSSLYYWRVQGALRIMRLYRSDRGALARLAWLQRARNSSEEVLHPPASTEVFADPNALGAGYASRTVLPLPPDPAKLALRYDPGIGSLARRLSVSRALYRGLRPAALDLLVALAARVRALAGGTGTLRVTSTVRDTRYQRLLGSGNIEAVRSYSLHTTGYAFDLARRYSSRAQARALQAMLDRLQALDLIAWVREPTAIHVTVASDASKAILSGP